MPAFLGLPGPAAYKAGQASSLSVRPDAEDCRFWVVSLSVAGFMRIMIVTLKRIGSGHTWLSQCLLTPCGSPQAERDWGRGHSPC